jgi:hypothetical protein
MIAKALEVNKTLKVLDLSENPIGADAGKELLSGIYINRGLIQLSLDKTQIEMSTRKFIDEKIAINYLEHGKLERELLMRENWQIKQKDRDRKENLETLNNNVENSKDYMRQLKTLVENLTIKLTTTKKRHQETVNNYEFEMSNLNKELMKVQVDNRPVLSKHEYSVSQLKE